MKCDCNETMKALHGDLRTLASSFLEVADHLEARLSAREQPQLADATDAAFKAGYVEGQKAAAPPPVQPARGPCTCNRNYVDDDEHAPDCGTQKPTPAPAASVPQPGEAEVVVVEYPIGPARFGIETTDRQRFWNGEWIAYGSSNNFAREWGNYHTRHGAEADLPAAEAALAAAREVGKAEAEGFDANEWADAVIRSVNVTVTMIGNRCSADIPAGTKAAVVGMVKAIYAAGLAAREQPRRWPDEKPEEGTPYLWWDAPDRLWRGCDFQEKYLDDSPMFWLHQPPAPKEVR